MTPYVTVDENVRLHYVTAGLGPLVVLLHGFPAYSLMWQRQIDALARAGFRVVAPDLRGYGLSDQPRSVGAYDVRVLARDVERLIAALATPDDGGTRTAGDHAVTRNAEESVAAAVVGHDWGGVIAWALAMRAPERLQRLVVINAPHPGTFGPFLLSHPDQMRRSAYMAFFQLPWLPEALLRARDFALIRRELPGDHRYIQALRRGRALTSALNYYRALPRAGLRTDDALRTPIKTPTLVIWGDRDRFLRPELADPDPRLVPNARVVRLPSIGHWPPLDAPDEVNRHLLAFLGDRGSAYPG